MRLNEKKVVASFEVILMIASLFAFSYFIGASEEVFNEIIDASAENEKSSFVKSIFEKLNEPIIPLVSAEIFDETIFGDSVLIENTTKTVFDISSNYLGAGCCELTVDGQKCATAMADVCSEGALFAEGALCSAISFCRKGCCYDEDAGIYDKNVLKLDCPKSWIEDPNCNLPAARLGCCILGTNSIFETEGQCRIDSESRALGVDSIVDWDGEVNEAQCLMLSANQTEGACVLAEGNCKFVTDVDCLNYGGEFNEGYLCTSSSLDTVCESTEETSCVDGKDGVYFVDSCGNYANVYDSSKLYDEGYWDKVVPLEDSCSSGNIGNANSKVCGNCNRFLGGICSSASDENFDVDFGGFYCKATSCVFEGETYLNGESWCVYDGKIGDGDDVVGSRHWKYVCSQGVVQIEPCADYRNQICIQTNVFDFEGEDVQFKNAACIANNWRECIDLNGKEDGLNLCGETLNCRVESVDISEYFKFDTCTPKYPGGFSFKDVRYQETAGNVCGMADQTCTVVYRPKTWGGCELVANGECLEEKFAQEMNDLCRSLGDCGGSANIEGVYSGNYMVGNSPTLGQGYISGLKALANPVEGQFAEVENYDKYLEAAGLLVNQDSVAEGDGNGGSITTIMNSIGAGFAGIGYAVGMVATGSIKVTLASLQWSAGGVAYKSLAVFSGAAIGAGIGMVAGAMLAKSLGLSSGGSLLMSIGGGLVGGAIGYGILSGGGILAISLGPIGIAILIIGIILMIASLFFGKDDCPPVTVTFECKSWQPPVGGNDCGKCNEDSLKPCSKYRCRSLGASCELVNVGSDSELCIDRGRDDTNPPRIEPQLGTISPDEKYSDISEKGFSMTSLQGDCISAYSSIVFGITTDEPAQCRFDLVEGEFEELSFDLGGNYYSYNHTTTFMLPDPSHGQSQGGNWTGDLTFYVKCRDTNGHENPGFYTVDMCVREGEDKTAPVIRRVNPADGSIVNFGTSSENLTIITNELSTCKWDVADVDYSLMINSMNCNDVLTLPSSPAGYVCSGELPIINSTSKYYIRCMDQPWLNSTEDRNANTQSYVYTLRKPEKKIEIDGIEPSEDFEVNTEMTTIELEIQTSGGGEFHSCSYSFSGYENMIEMFETGTERVHVQQLNRPSGTNKIYVECYDETGDSVQGSTNFKIIQDTSTPQVARFWQVGSTLYIVTTEDAECVYGITSCNYAWDNGTFMGTSKTHTISATAGKIYYIKCRDDFGNVPSDCSIQVQVT
ncbi:hypothetical protein KAI32_02375 [Candidatus Pacearchaeota archaeon]|nr:hypothetical protein [Candidatus Pacearchaeota archaeon]